MKRTTKYVALDVHQATTVASVREESGRVIARTILPTEAAALLEFVGGMRGAIHVAFEEGTQAQWLDELLAPRVDRVVVCDRRGEPRQGNKGDVVDADQLSERLRQGGLRAVYHGGAHLARGTPPVAGPFARPAVRPRHSPNARPPRRTRTSVRPALAAESQIEPWFASARPSACIGPGRIGSSREENDAEADCAEIPSGPVRRADSNIGADCPGQILPAIRDGGVGP